MGACVTGRGVEQFHLNDHSFSIRLVCERSVYTFRDCPVDAESIVRLYKI